VLAVASVLASLAASSVSCEAQTKASIRVRSDTALERIHAMYPVAEPHLSTHRTNADLLFVSALEIKEYDPYPIFDCVLFSSDDRGSTWSRTDLDFELCGNTWGAVAGDGTLLFVGLTEPAGIVHYRADLRAYRSDDGGATWSDAQEFGAGFDYPKIVIDPSSEDVYVVGTRAFRVDSRILHRTVVARSADVGRTFPDSIHLHLSPNTHEAQVPVILGDGSLVIPYTEHSTEDGAPLDGRRSWLVVSDDRGRTFSEPRLIAEGCGGGGAGWPYLVGGRAPSGTRDRIYWLCSADSGPGIWIQHSDDVGLTWSARVRVDNPGPEAYAAYALATNARGIVGVMWLAQVGTREPCNRLFFTASVDGGESFLRPVNVSEEDSCPSRDPRNAAAYAHRARAGGDYNGIAAGADGSFHMVWADARDGVYRLRHSIAEVSLEP
jgi:hypothetical protein